MNETIFRFLIVLVIFTCTILSMYVIPYLKSRIRESNYAVVLSVVESAVKAVEQTTQEKGKGAIKKAEVVAFLHSWLTEKGIMISEDQLDQLIEAAVYTMKRG